MGETLTRRCPDCGEELECKLRDFSIGADGGGGLAAALFYEHYEVDLYACPRCGRVVLYTAGSHKKEEPEGPKNVEVTCPKCGAKHSSLINCPMCALNGAYSRPSAQRPEKKKKDRKPPWER